MKYGHFDDANREYVITNPKTPFPWINYLGDKDFFSLISNTAGGYSFYKDAKIRFFFKYFDVYASQRINNFNKLLLKKTNMLRNCLYFC